jgi:mono/diheme cytochrome c family protein
VVATLRTQSPTALQTMSPQAMANFGGSLGEVIIIARMLRDRLSGLTSLSGGASGPGQGPGRVDAFGSARNRIYTHNRVPTTAPVSFPHLWDFPSVRWLHWDANTNSIMERNIGQALGVGGIFDRKTLRSTLNPVNIHRLEQLSRRLAAPEWPTFFPAINTERASRGKALFGQYCAGCHVSGLQDDNCYPVGTIGTDPRRAENFALRLGNGRFTDSVASVLHRMKDLSYQTFKVPAGQWQEYNGGLSNTEVVWRTTGTYGVRSLNGVWATAPYLHNGSVPNLYELLLPPQQRSVTFPIGHSLYDPVRVGYSMTEAGTYSFDTRIVGNGNGGHAYGTNLSDQERWELVEYLKTLGTYSGPVTPQEGTVRCTALD